MFTVSVIWSLLGSNPAEPEWNQMAVDLQRDRDGERGQHFSTARWGARHRRRWSACITSLILFENYLVDSWSPMKEYFQEAKWQALICIWRLITQTASYPLTCPARPELALRWCNSMYSAERWFAPLLSWLAAWVSDHWRLICLGYDISFLKPIREAGMD